MAEAFCMGDPFCILCLGVAQTSSLWNGCVPNQGRSDRDAGSIPGGRKQFNGVALMAPASALFGNGFIFVDLDKVRPVRFG